MRTCFNKEGNSGCEVSTALKRCSSSWVWMDSCLGGFFPCSSSAAFALIELGSFSMASIPPSVSLLSTILDISTSRHSFHLHVSYLHPCTPLPGSETRPCADPFLLPSHSRAWLGTPARVQDLVHPTASRSSRSRRTSGGLTDVLGALCPSRTVRGALTNRLSSSKGPSEPRDSNPPLCGTRSRSVLLKGHRATRGGARRGRARKGRRAASQGDVDRLHPLFEPRLKEEQRSHRGGSPSDGPRKTRGRNERRGEGRVRIRPRNGRRDHVARTWTGEDLDRRHIRSRRTDRSEHVDRRVQVDPADSSADVALAGRRNRARCKRGCPWDVSCPHGVGGRTSRSSNALASETVWVRKSLSTDRRCRSSICPGHSQDCSASRGHSPQLYGARDTPRGTSTCPCVPSVSLVHSCAGRPLTWTTVHPHPGFLGPTSRKGRTRTGWNENETRATSWLRGGRYGDAQTRCKEEGKPVHGAGRGTEDEGMPWQRRGSEKKPAQRPGNKDTRTGGPVRGRNVTPSVH